MYRGKKLNSKYSSNSSISVDLSSNQVADKCDGWLWVKEVAYLTSKYVKRWCVLDDKLLSIYSEKYYYAKGGQLKNEINILVCRITPVLKPRKRHFFFQISNDWCTNVFATSNEGEYAMWLYFLQNSSSDFDWPEDFDFMELLMKGYDREQGLYHDDSLPFRSHIPEDLSIFVDELNLDTNRVPVLQKVNKFQNSIENSSHSSRFSQDFTDSSGTTESVDQTQILLFAKLKNIERQIREKRILLAKIDDALKYSQFPDQIDQFFDDNKDQIVCT